MRRSSEFIEVLKFSINILEPFELSQTKVTKFWKLREFCGFELQCWMLLDEVKNVLTLFCSEIKNIELFNQIVL